MAKACELDSDSDAVHLARAAQTELFADALFESFNQEDKQLVITKGESVLSNPPIDDIDSLSPCSHEEADSRMMLHVAHAAHHNHHKIIVRTVDTDVVVLAVHIAQNLGPEDELWLKFGTGKNLRYLAAHTIASSLGPEKTQALPMFHTLTGCDTVSSFVGHGKKTAWKIWKVYPELTDALYNCLVHQVKYQKMLCIQSRGLLS